MCHITTHEISTERLRRLVEILWDPLLPCKRQAHNLNRFQGKRLPDGEEDLYFSGEKAQKEEAPPQLYGTSYLLVKIALTGLLVPPFFAACVSLSRGIP